VPNFGTCKKNAAGRCRLRIKKRVWLQKFVGSRHCAAAFFLQVSKLCTDLNHTLLCISIPRTYTTFLWKHEILVLGVCFLQSCSSAGRRFATSRSRLHYFKHIGLPAKLLDYFLRSDKSNINQNSEKHLVPTTTNSMKYIVNSIPLRICVRSRNIQPHLNQPRKFQLPPSKPLCQALPARLATSLLRTIGMHFWILRGSRGIEVRQL